jgi:hypothetical protein
MRVVCAVCVVMVVDVVEDGGAGATSGVAAIKKQEAVPMRLRLCEVCIDALLNQQPSVTQQQNPNLHPLPTSLGCTPAASSQPAPPPHAQASGAACSVGPTQR